MFGCGRIGYDRAGDHELVVQLVTGLVPGAEFVTVRTEVLSDEAGDLERVSMESEARANLGANYADGHQVASFALRSGLRTIRVRLFDARGVFLVEQRARILLESNYVLRVHITRDCVGVECPSPGGGPELLGCLNGRCVDPRCAVESPEFCPEIVFCHDESECRVTSECATQSCDEGVCTPVAIVGSCSENEWCNPDPGAGCQTFDPEVGDPRCGTICEPSDAPCQAGFYNCADPGSIVCEPLFNRVAGTECGLHSYCDVGGECAACPEGAGCRIGCARGHVECAAAIPTCVLNEPAEYVDAATACADTGACVDGEPCTTNGACNGSGMCDVTGAGPPGIVVSPLLGLTTTETGGTATISVRLASIPDSVVQVAVTSSDSSEGSISAGGVLVFTPDNWNGVQSTTMTGADDLLMDGNQTYAFHFAVVSPDDDYAALSVDDLAVLNIDNESAGITVAPTSGVVVSETGTTETFSLILSTMPSADVVVNVASDTPSEGTVSPSTLTFTSLDWAAPHIVTVTGVDDPFTDGNQAFVIVTEPALSADSVYNGIDPDDVAAQNNDDDVPALVVSPVDGLVTTEAGAFATFTVSLTSHPLMDVTLDLTSLDPGEGTVSPASITFTSDNWDSLQLVTVSGVDDFRVDGDQVYSVAVAVNPTSDSSYASLPMQTVMLTNLDDETAGIVVTPTLGLTTTEGGGTDTFSVVLTSSPTANVILGISSSDVSEGVVAPATLTFTPINWNAPQVVTVTGVNDAMSDGNQLYSALTASAFSGDSHYNGMNPSDVTLTNIDDDTSGIVVTPTSGLVTTEAGGTAAFTVRLNTMPSASVSIGLSSSDLTEGTVSPASLTFTTGNWATPQTVTATGVNDAVADGTQPYFVVTAPASSTDGTYNSLDALNVSITNTDNDSPGITVSALGSPGHTTESGGVVTFSLTLQSQPTADVQVGVASSDLTEGTVLPVMLNFTTGDWNAPHTVTVTGVDDALLDGNQPFTVLLAAAASADSTYAGINPADVMIQNFDNDTPGYTISPSSVQVTEGGGTATFTMQLTAQPSADVSIGLTASDATEATVMPASLTFTNGNWNVPQTVTVTGVDDASADGNITSSIVTAPVMSADVRFAGTNPGDITVVTLDDDVPRIVSSSATGMPADALYQYSYMPSVSSDGRYIAFASNATNVIVGDTNGTYDVFVRDMVASTIERVSVGDDESQGDGASLGPAMSADGRFVVFMSSSTNWVAGAPSDRNLVYMRDRLLGTTVLVSAQNGSYALPGYCLYGMRGGSVSADGRYVLFSSCVDSLGVMGVFGNQFFIRDTQTLSTTLASVGTGGLLPNGQCLSYGTFDLDRTLSSDGRYMVMSCDSSNFMMGDTAGSYDLFWRDLVMNVTLPVNVTPMGTHSSGGAAWPRISSDGRYVTFQSPSTDLVAGHTGARTDIFLRDMMSGVTVLASPSASGGITNQDSYYPTVSADGRYVAFSSAASNLVAGDTNAVQDIFVRDVVAGTNARASVGPGGAQLFSWSTMPIITDDGRYIAFGSSSGALVAGDTNALHDLFVVPRP